MPLTATPIVPAPPSPLTLTVVLFGPAELGWKRTPTVHDAPTGTTAGQLLVTRNCPELAPDFVTFLIGSWTLPVFVTRMVCSALSVLRSWLPKLSDSGVTLKVETTPVPPRLTVPMAAPAPGLTLSVATLDPADVGLKTTLMVQDAPAARLVPQLWV